MQQFASAASSQVRPPIALAATSAIKRVSRKAKGRDCPIHAIDATKTRQSIVPIIRKEFEENHIFPSSRQSVITNNNVTEDGGVNSEKLIERRGHSDLHNTGISISNNNIQLVRRLQEPLKDQSPVALALDRAMKVCIQHYSQHGHNIQFPLVLQCFSTETKINELSDIAYNVAMRNLMMRDNPNAKEIAQQKKNKWSKVTAYVVASVKNQPEQKVCKELTIKPYSELPYVPPQTELQLRAYGESCAAVQILLGSLRDNQMGAKWITGPVTRTVAFRQLIGAEAKDRIVGLLMVGSKTEYNPK